VAAAAAALMMSIMDSGRSNSLTALGFYGRRQPAGRRSSEAVVCETVGIGFDGISDRKGEIG